MLWITFFHLENAVCFGFSPLTPKSPRFEVFCGQNMVSMTGLTGYIHKINQWTGVLCIFVLFDSVLDSNKTYKILSQTQRLPNKGREGSMLLVRLLIDPASETPLNHHNAQYILYLILRLVIKLSGTWKWDGHAWNVRNPNFWRDQLTIESAKTLPPTLCDQLIIKLAIILPKIVCDHFRLKLRKGNQHKVGKRAPYNGMMFENGWTQWYDNFIDAIVVIKKEWCWLNSTDPRFETWPCCHD